MDASNESQQRQLSAEDLRNNFKWFSIWFGINHGVVTTPLIIATSVLNPSVGYMGGALLNIFTVVSSLCFGAVSANSWGFKGAIMRGMFLYCVYIGFFTIAIILGPNYYVGQYFAYCVGSTCGGLAAGILWTNQGGYFARTVDLLLPPESDTSTRSELTAELAASFAFYYLAFEVVAKVTWSLLDYMAWKSWLVGGVFVSFAVSAMLGMDRCIDLGGVGTAPGLPPARWYDTLHAAVSLWRDPVIFLLSGINFTFGFSGAFMNGYVNGEITSPELGNYAVPLLGAFSVLFAAIVAPLLGSCGGVVGKGSVVLLGSASFMSIALSFQWFGCCSGWGWKISVLYMFQGMGRAVYESTNKGIFTDFFPGDSVGAFANCMLQSALAFALGFFLSSVLQGPALVKLVLILSLLTPPACAFAYSLRRSTGVESETTRLEALD